MAFTFSGRHKLVPPKLLNDDDDDDVVSESRSITRNESNTEWILNGCGSSGSSWSALSSPLGSELGSTEAETETVSEGDDDDGFIAELTRQMADYMLEEDDEKPAEKCCSENLSKDLPGLPKDTVSGSDSELGSRDHHGERLHSNQNRPISVPAETFQAFSDDQSRAVHLEDQPSLENQGYVSWGRRGKKTELTHLGAQKQRLRHPKPHQIQNRGRAASVSSGGFWLPAMAWPPLQTHGQQQQAGSGSGMRAVFLGGPGSRNGSCGTGVFLPRGTGDPSEVRKKPGCSTVLIPARVLHTLQLHFQELNTRRSQSKTCPGFTSNPIQQEASGARRDEQHSHQKQRAQSPTDDCHHHHEDMGLPQEWTY